MPKQKQSLQLNNLNRGIITEANPLNQPLGSSVDELNININNDGTRQRRLGMGMEASGVLINLPSEVLDPDTIGYNSFKWDLTDTNTARIFTVVQFGTVLEFFEFDAENGLSPNKLASVNLEDALGTETFKFAAVDSFLVVATSNGVYSIEDKGTDSINFVASSIDLKIRDFFGVADYIGGTAIDRGNEVQQRVSNAQNNSVHVYNLFNQGWPNKQVWCFRNNDGRDKFKEYPVRYTQDNLSVAPSNADVFALYSVSDTEENPRSVEGFNTDLMDRGLEYNAEAPKGNYIIDLFDRGASRTQESGVNNNGGGSKWRGSVQSLPADRSPRQIKAVAEFAGRVFYAGFNSEVFGGDDRSPNLSNYVVFSQLINYSNQLGQCYQVASPTNKDDPDLVPTDGGAVRISGAVGINHLEAIGNSLMVFAENGVWQILGGSDFGFSADNYQVIKVTERGSVSPRGVVNVGEQAVWCSDNGIYITETTDQGVAIAKELTRETIKTLYESILNKQTMFGAYDEFERTVRWVYEDTKELIFRVDTGAWTRNETKDGQYDIKAIVKVPPLLQSSTNDTVTSDGEQVFSDGDPVTTTVVRRDSETVELKYLSVNDTLNNYTFSLYNNTSFRDWDLADADGYMITSYFTGGDGSKHKQFPYVTMHFNKTELGFDENFDPLNPSSCLVQPRWDFSDSSVSGKFGGEFQAYRFRRHFFPAGPNDPFNNGYETVVTKNKVRGRGKSLQFRIRTEAEKDLHLIGWEQEVTVNEQ